MNKVSIVILNYLNYLDTIECVESIFKMNYELEGIVIVDNHSHNESFKILSRKYKKYNKIVVVKTGSNYGFAKGNNIGIAIARQRFHTDFVLVVNNDTIFEQKDYLEKLLNHYEYGVGMIGSAIHLKGNVVQKEEVYDISFQGTFRRFVKLNLKKVQKDIWCFLIQNVKEKKEVKFLHGCIILFTPDFFKHYNGFYKRTFLYAEEPILYLMCKKYKLWQVYVHDIYIYHKEDQSSKMSFKNDFNTMEEYRRQSYIFLIWWIIKDNVYQRIRGLLRLQNREVYKSTAESDVIKKLGNEL